MRLLKIGPLLVSLAFSLAPNAVAEPKPLVAGAPVRFPLIEGRDIRFTHLSTEQGLSQSRVDHMLQDRRGFIWIGTYNGLNRHDGYRFKTYKPASNNPNSLGGLRVTALFEDRSGILWIGIDEGLDRFDPATETFTHFRADPNNPHSPSGPLEHITQDRDGILWLATRNGLDRLDPASGRFTHYRNDPNDTHSLTNNDVRFALEDRHGTLWVATAAGIDALDRRTGRVLRYSSSSQQTPLDRILEDRAGILWVSATRGGGLASLDPKTGRFTRYTFVDDRRNAPGMRGCSAILEDQHGMLWLATRPDGVVKFDRKLRRFTRYRNDPANPTSLNSNDALSLLQDHEGGIWVGTNGGGVNRFPSAAPPFTIYRKEPGNPNSLDQSYALSVFEDSQRTLWIGTEQLNRLDRKTGRYTFYRHDPADLGSITNGTVRAIAEDPAGVMWFGTWGGGLNRFDRRTGRFKAYRHDPADAASLSNDFILSLLIDHRGNLWVGTDDGLNRLDARTGRLTVFRTKSGSLEHRWFRRVLAEGTDGSIWIGTYTQGLQRLDVRTGDIVEYKNDPKVRGSLSNNRVNALYLDHRGTLWAGTQNGLNRFDRNTGEFTTFNERDGLPNNAVEGILEDAAGNLWLSTGNGLSRFDPRTRAFKNYYSDDGLAGDEFSDFSVYHKSARGEMFFGGVTGITAFYPDQVIETPYIPPLVLTDFRLFNDSVPIGGKSPLKKSITYTDTLTLSHQQNIFTLEFSALSFSSPGRNRYRYRLEGLESEWNETDSSRRIVTYTTLTPGEYVFQVQGSGNHGGWNLQGRAVRIEILPPLWRTTRFYALYAASFLTLLWLAYEFRVRQLQREFNMRLEGRVEERTRIARELHDTLLQSIQGLMFSFQAVRNMLPGRSEDAIRTLDHAIRKGDEAIAESRDAIQGLRANPAIESDLEHLLTALGTELSSRAECDAPAFRVTVEGLRQPLSPLLQDEVYRIAREILRNAFCHAHATRIEAEIVYDSQFFRLRIRDNGKGLDPKILDAGTREGHWGLPGVRERAKRIGARLQLWSELGAGTEAELTVPARIAYGTVHRRMRLRLFRRSKAEPCPPDIK